MGIFKRSTNKLFLPVECRVEVKHTVLYFLYTRKINTRIRVVLFVKNWLKAAAQTFWRN
jgi:hypothetical protein